MYNSTEQKNLFEQFYKNIDRERTYCTASNASSHIFFNLLINFIQKWNLKGKKCLEIGSNKGIFQNIVEDYTGVDVAEYLSKYYHKKYVAVSGSTLPFSDESFDSIWTYATHEHIPDIESALSEIIRVLRPGGVCLFAPAWHTRPWFAQGIQVRSYSELSLKQKFIKISIPLRDFVLIRWPRIILGRLCRLMKYIHYRSKKKPLFYKKLNANYEVFWQSDSDACNSLDPFDIILWFKSRGVICHGYENFLKILSVRTCALELQKPLVISK
jgi:SAM-dependent methyltransferase